MTETNSLTMIIDKTSIMTTEKISIIEMIGKIIEIKTEIIMIEIIMIEIIMIEIIMIEWLMKEWIMIESITIESIMKESIMKESIMIDFMIIKDNIMGFYLLIYSRSFNERQENERN